MATHGADPALRGTRTRRDHGETPEGYTHTAYGEEATAVGVIALLRADDWLTSTYRNHHHAIARGIPSRRSLASSWVEPRASHGGKGGSMHVADQDLGMIGGMGIVAAGLPIAAGAAFAAKYLGEDRVAVSFFGDGAVHQGAWHEALEFAASSGARHLRLREQPLRRDDGRGLSPERRRRSRPWRRPTGSRPPRSTAWMCSPSARGTGQAIDRARAGGGPTLIEAMTYRYGGQYEGDSQTYKPPCEVER